MNTQHPSPVAGAAATSSAAAKATSERSVLLCTGPRLCQTVAEAIDAYMQHYSGRDASRVYRLEMWKRRVGDRLLAEFTDDDVFHELEAIAAEPARVFNGYDADGRRIYRNKKTPKSPATIDGYANALAAVMTWCIKKRRVPKSFESSCRKVERLPLRNAVVRFLSDDERERLLAACRASCWPNLYALVLMALTIGARRAELLGLRWRDLRDRAIAYLARSKNGEPRVLPLVPAVLEELQRLEEDDRTRFKIAAADQLIFHSRIKPGVAYNFMEAWRDALKAARVRNFRFTIAGIPARPTWHRRAPRCSRSPTCWGIGRCRW